MNKFAFVDYPNLTEKHKEAFRIMEDSNKHLFLTGDAGTGKTTLIKHFLQYTEKNVVILAPTGVAAVNAGGQTVHSFFRFPPRTVSYSSIKRLQYDEKIMMDKVDTIIIDEISMVRVDMMDNIAWFFKKNYGEIPLFGGKQLIMVGDLDQLPPVVASQSERKFIDSRYGGSEFFFSAECWMKEKFEIVKLDKVYRQTDPTFINLLNTIKKNQADQGTLDAINGYMVKTDISIDDGVCLASTNAQVNEINERRLRSIQEPEIVLKAICSGRYNARSMPVSEEIIVKKGCKIMTLRNCPNGQYHNGTVCEFVDYNKTLNAIEVEINGNKTLIHRFEFENVKYKYDDTDKSISSSIEGRVMQFPIRVAYAITIHKSQGKTFDKCIIYPGNRIFAHGQLYVALSRCTTMQGVTLTRPIRMDDMTYNYHVDEFINKSE